MGSSLDLVIVGIYMIVLVAIGMVFGKLVKSGSDYFKAGAIELAWTLITESYGFDPERLWATVYLDDDEAEQLWLKYLPSERIQRRDGKDNYWDMGVPGPGGELQYAAGPRGAGPPGAGAPC